MTNTQQWGAPLTGEQMKLLRAAGLPANTTIRVWEDFPTYLRLSECSFSPYVPYFLPADHVAYTLLEKGWLDIPNVRLWFGGDKAPDDWLKTPNSVLFRSGDVSLVVADWTWEHFSSGGDIIAYIAKAEDDESDDGPCTSCYDTGEDVQTERRCACQTETVTIAKMTDADVERLVREFDYDISAILNSLGLIKPEPTREERFWQRKERHSLYHDESARALIDAALEFER